MGANYHLGSAAILPAVHADIAVYPISAFPPVPASAIVEPGATLAIHAYPACALRASYALTLRPTRTIVGAGVASCESGDEEPAASGAVENELGRWMGWRQRRVQLQYGQYVSLGVKLVILSGWMGRAFGGASLTNMNDYIFLGLCIYQL